MKHAVEGLKDFKGDVFFFFFFKLNMQWNRSRSVCGLWYTIVTFSRVEEGKADNILKTFQDCFILHGDSVLNVFKRHANNSNFGKLYFFIWRIYYFFLCRIGALFP